MTRPRLAVLKLALATAVVVCGCSSEGKTPDCGPPLRLYDVNSAQSRADARAEMRLAAAKGCITLPAGFDTAGGDGAAGSGGSP
jgi:hypothetical protein